MRTANGCFDCVVFDLDGTLLDTRDAMMVAINAVLDRLRRSAVRAQELETSIHQGLAAMLRHALTNTGGLPDEDLHRKLYTRLRREYFASARQRVAPYPELLTVLEGLRARGAFMAVCTNQAEADARHLLEVFGLDDYFVEVVGRDTFAVHKPDPLPLIWLMGRGRAHPRQTLMVGDSEVDAQCAERAGASVVLMEHGYGAPLANGHASARDFASLHRVLNRPATSAS